MNSNYSNFSKEELLKLVQNKDKELKSKKYGLIWDSEREPEQVVLDCENNLPVLKRLKSKEIKTNDEGNNILIEGDNYHALSVLNYTHKEKVDVIYIDPPYNTGNKDFIYNDRYVDKEDGYRHSKWLNFMEKRLKLAHNLLKKTGVIFISIDDNEMAQLKLLCDKIFGEENFVGQITREAIKGGSQSKHIRVCDDYVLIYAKKESELSFSGYSKEGILLNLEDGKGVFAKGRELNKWGAGSRREDAPGMYFSIEGPNREKVYPIRNDGSEGRWRWGKKKMLKNSKENNFIFEKREDGTYIVYEKVRDSSEKIKQFTTLFKNKYINAKGSEKLKEIFGTSMSIFNFAKPVELIYDLLIMADTNKDALILDFMAGSGTTAQAVLDLNKEDGGNRKFILCTNNENNICTNVTYPRIKKIILGYLFEGHEKTLLYENKLAVSKIKLFSDIENEIEDIKIKEKVNFNKIDIKIKDNTISIQGIKVVDKKKDGLGGGLQYLKTTLIKISKNKEQLKINLTNECTEMLCVKENIFNLKKGEEDCKIFESNQRDKFLCVYYNFMNESFNKFLEEIKKLKGKKKIYVFSLGGKIDRSLFKDISNFKLEPIPQKILDIYRQLVKQNIPLKKDLLFLEFSKAKKLIFEDGETEESPKRLRIVLENVLKKIAQNNSINIFENNSEKRINKINDELKNNSVISQVEWEENKTYLTIGNQASHGNYEEYDLEQIKNFYKHIQNLINKFEL